MITEQMIEKAHADFTQFDEVNPAIIPSPTRMFEVGDDCQVGNLKSCVIAEVLHNGKAYRVDCISVDNNHGRNPIDNPKTAIWWWFDVEPIDFCNREASELFAPYLPGQIQNSTIESLIHMMGHNGLVCDPRYQREYVWSLENQQNLIDSIFNRINIGSLIFSRHSGYLYEDSKEVVTYINLDGSEVQIPRKTDYTSAIIDGQQRVTTIWRFVTNQFQYKGRYFRDLTSHDQNNFTNTMIVYRLFDEDSVPYKEVLRMFIQTNRGVPQDQKHLAKVVKQLECLDD